ncbi:hypothetical protein OG417_45080 [Actinoallomurus sp. NBC_01490]|uniref:hypothetical protein n=1 Tax=Actinoallomurus sp. NBC_01490 TaxID=2903557 RepID=UPI002E329E34|nr:hypothetical protein [Actinoallomurus sp. NBC_01490]
MIPESLQDRPLAACPTTERPHVTPDGGHSALVGTAPAGSRPLSRSDLMRLQPISWRTPDGIGVDIRRTTLPPGFAARLENDFDDLYRNAAERTGDCGGVLLYFDQKQVAGRSALRRVERIADGRYAAVLIVVVTNDVGVVVIVECCASAGAHIQADHAESALERTCKLVDDVADFSFLGLESHDDWQVPAQSTVEQASEATDSRPRLTTGVA